MSKYTKYRYALWACIISLAATFFSGFTGIFDSLLFGFATFILFVVAAVIIFVGGGHAAPTKVTQKVRRVYRITITLLPVAVVLAALGSFIAPVFVIFAPIIALMMVVIFVTTLLLLVMDKYNYHE